MTISTLKSCQIAFPHQQPGNHLSQCQLQWRQGQLLVKPSGNSQQLYLRSLDNQQELVQCLKNSPVRLVQIDAKLGHLALKSWFKACQQAKKPVFVRQTVDKERQAKQLKLNWYVQLIDLIVAFLLLILLSPVMLAIVILQMYVYSPKAIFSGECCIGSRGKLFQALRFRTKESNSDTCTTFLGYWLCKYRLDKLPQLLNILRGEMSLLKPGTVSLSDVVGVSIKEQEEETHLTSLPWNDLEGGFVAEA